MKTTSTTKPAGTFKRSAITSQELEEIKAEHIPDERGYACACCEEPWPCDKVRLVVRIEELEKGLRAILREHGPEIWQWGGEHCGICSPQDKHYPCVTAQEARAALGGDE